MNPKDSSVSAFRPISPISALGVFDAMSRFHRAPAVAGGLFHPYANLPTGAFPLAIDALARSDGLVQTSGRTIEQVADDLGIGRSTLGKWLAKHREADLLSGPHEDTAKELARLRKENDILRAERDLLKKAAAFFAKETSR